MKNKIDSISIVLTCYNGENTIFETLDSINKQSLENFELVVIDDGSIDRTPEIIRNFNFRKDISVNFISRPNKGSLPSLSEGVDAAKGTYIARIDHDDLWTSNHLESLWSAFESNPNLVLVGTQAVVFDSNYNILKKTRLPLTHENIIRAFMHDNPFVHSSVMFKKDAYYKTSGYLCGNDEESTQIADYNLWIELACHGQVMNLDEYSVKYRYQQVSLSRNIKKRKNYKSRLYVMRKAHSLFDRYTFYYYRSALKVWINIVRYSM